jgi:DUF4097 and DUF4098 domain-containing protein YvlB
MPTFVTPEPISATIELVVGDARVTASDRDDTVVDVRPSDSSHEPDVRAAEQTRVEYAAGRLLVKTARQRNLGLFGKVGSIDVTIDLPAGSHLQCEGSVAAFHCMGRLGECRVKTSTGDIQFDHAGNLDLSTSSGTIVVDRVVGRVEASTGTGPLRIREIHGAGVLRNSNGDIWVGEITGNLQANAANGDIRVDRAHADIIAKTVNGDVGVGEVARGSVSLKTACGEIEIGVRAGSVALLDLHTAFGRVLNHMDLVDSPDLSDDTIDVHARTGYGDILIRRSSSASNRLPEKSGDDTSDPRPVSDLDDWTARVVRRRGGA